jgi:16S rRNA (guanine(1405)-N(7))-methyltransferase
LASPAFAKAHVRIVESVLAARHFRHLSPDLVARVTDIEAPKAPRHADAVDRVKKRLHQVANAYAPALHAPRDAVAAIRAAAGDDDALRTLAISLMYGHASTAERLPDIDIVVPALRRAVTPDGAPAPSRIVDLACGLNPLLLPWLALPRTCVYDAYDVDARLIDIVDAFLNAWGQAGSATVRDVGGNLVRDPADLAILMKAVPCLDQVQPGNARRVLEALDVRRAIVTWPVQSLSGANKGMRATYRRTCAMLVDGLPYAVSEVVVPGELVFILDRTDAPPIDIN